MNYTVKTRTEKRPRALVAIQTTAPTVDGRLVIAEETVYLAELFEDGVYELCGEGETEQKAFNALRRALDRAFEAERAKYMARTNRLYNAQYGEIPFA